MILAVQRPIGCPGVAACVWITATIGVAAIERPMGSADQKWPIDRPGRSTHSSSHRPALRQPVRFTLLTQYQVGLYSLLGAAFQQRMLILFQRLPHRLAERRQVHHVLIASCGHKRQVGVVEVAARIRRGDVGITDHPPSGVPSTVR